MVQSIEVKVESDLHRKIVQAVRARRKLSESRLSHLRKRWDDADAEHQIYVSERSADTLRKSAMQKSDRTEGYQYVDVHVPYSYAIMMSMHTYLCSVFLSRTPVLQYTSRHGAPEMNVMAVESLMDYQTTIGGHLAPYYVWLLDATKYGLGVAWQYWYEEKIAVARYVDQPIVRAGVTFEKTERVREMKVVEGYTGNRVFNVRPADYLPDPRVPLHSPNEGEFQGRKFFMGINQLYRGKASKQYINCDKVRGRINSNNGNFSGEGNTRHEAITEDLPDPTVTTGDNNDPTLISDFPCVEMIIELIPDHWGLGKSTTPEKWVFVVAYDEIVIEAHPYGMLHGKFPGETLEIEADGYNLGSRGILEVARPLNDTMNWLFNSHFYNVRKSLNGDIIYDPTRISTKDIMDGGPGKRIRVKPEAYGEDIRKFLHVVPGDAAVTQTHMRDMQIIGDMMNKVTGVSEQLMGQQSTGGRKSATEVRTASSGSINRMKTSAEYMSALGFAPFAQLLLQTTQQNYSQEKKFRIAGDLVENQEKFMEITPDSIAGQYDYVAVDGTLPIDRFAMVTMWTNFFGQVRNFPEVAQTYDMGKAIGYVAQLGGLKNIKQFRINVGPAGQPPGTIPMQQLGGNNGRSGRGVPTPIGRGTANGAGDTPQLIGPGG